MPKVPSLPHRPRQSIDSQAVDMWTTLKKRSPHAHSHNKCKCQARSDIDQEAAVRFTSIRHITHIRRAQPTDSPEEAFNSIAVRLAGKWGIGASAIQSLHLRALRVGANPPWTSIAPDLGATHMPSMPSDL